MGKEAQQQDVTQTDTLMRQESTWRDKQSQTERHWTAETLLGIASYSNTRSALPRRIGSFVEL